MNNAVDLKLYLNNIPTKNNEMLKKHDVNQGWNQFELVTQKMKSVERKVSKNWISLFLTIMKWKSNICTTFKMKIVDFFAKSKFLQKLISDQKCYF